MTLSIHSPTTAGVSSIPLLSVMCITYNHARYLRECLESALRQQTDFPCEILVADDASTDGAWAVAQATADEHPGRLKLVRRDRNLGLVGNFLATYADCRGRYIAVLEGDDYWTHPRKLQQQVEFLEANPRYSCCFHDVELLLPDGTRQPRCCPADQPRTIGVEQALIHNYVPNCSALVMRNRRQPFPAWLAELAYYDWPLHVLNAEQGPLAYLDEAWSTYRIHNAGAWHGRHEELRLTQTMQLASALDRHFDGEYRHLTQLSLESLAHQREAARLRQALAQTSPVGLWSAVKLALKQTPGVHTAWRGLKASAGFASTAFAARPQVPPFVVETQTAKDEAKPSASDSNSASRDEPADEQTTEAPATLRLSAARTSAARRTKTLAALGGRPCFPQPLYVGTPNLGDETAFFDLVHGALERRRLSNQGPLVEEFERRVQPLTGGRHVVSAANATLGLQLALRGFDLTGEVICPSHTFIATAHAVEWEGLTPVFADVDPDTHNLDPRSAAACITPRTSAILGVHLWGRPCAVDELSALAKRHGLRLIYDAAHAVGCTHQGRPVGDFGDAAVFSFHATKVLSAGEGGCIVTSDDALAQRLRGMRSFGFTGQDQVSRLGINAKMNELNAALGLVNLDAFPRFVQGNHENHRRYAERLSRLPGLKLLQYDDREQTNRQYVVVEVDDRICGLTRDQLVTALTAENVMARRFFSPGCHRSAPYADREYGPLPHSERLADQVLALPNGSVVSPDVVDRVCDCVQLALEHAAEVRVRLGDASVQPTARRAA